MLEWQAIDKMLQQVPRGMSGTLPFDVLATKPEWQQLEKGGRTPEAIRAAIYRKWKKSLIPVEAPAPVHLNHAYNYCPGCGMKLN